MTLSNEIKYRLLAGRLARDFNSRASSARGDRQVHVNLDNVGVVNGHSMSYHRPLVCRTVHLFAFGAYGNTYVLAFGSLESALESAAATLKEVAPGCFVEPDYRESSDSMGYDWDAFVKGHADGWDRVAEDAEQDLTYTESGWLASWEWTVVASGWSPDEIRAWARNER